MNVARNTESLNLAPPLPALPPMNKEYNSQLATSPIADAPYSDSGLESDDDDEFNPNITMTNWLVQDIGMRVSQITESQLQEKTQRDLEMSNMNMNTVVDDKNIYDRNNTHNDTIHHHQRDRRTREKSTKKDTMNNINFINVGEPYILNFLKQKKSE